MELLLYVSWHKSALLNIFKTLHGGFLQAEVMKKLGGDQP